MNIAVKNLFHPLTFLAFVILTTVLISCVTVNQQTFSPPLIPGATFVGSENCAQCHEEITKGFKTASHARLQAKGKNSENVGCESCHGPGSLHAESGGKKGTIVNPHKSPETCFQCHLDKRGEFNLPHSHPVLQGKVHCSDCHNPHKGDAVKSGGTQLHSQNETCFECHTAQRGPFVFEHEALDEGCTTCHQPHGSVNPRMLIARDQNLCLRCHFQQQTTGGQVLIGGRDHSSFLLRGTCFSGDCHEAVHGSHVSSSLRR